MARPKVYSINLTDEERSKLNKVIKNKTTCKTVLKRCQILRDFDESKGCKLTHAQIAHTYTVCPATVSNIIRDYRKQSRRKATEVMLELVKKSSKIKYGYQDGCFNIKEIYAKK